MRENPLHGDMNWVVPDKILAFAGPTNEVYSVEEFSEYAKMKHVNTVVRLNRVRYDAEVLKTKGIQHFDMFIHDGNIPTLQQIDEFYGIAERAWNTGAMAVHCRAGLGRTGTMIATFLIKKFNLQASDVIAYLRMMRPGSVLGMQARYLDSIQYMLRGESIPDDAKAYLSQYYPDQFHTIEVSSGSEAEGQQVDSNQADDHFAEPAIRAH